MEVCEEKVDKEKEWVDRVKRFRRKGCQGCIEDECDKVTGHDITMGIGKVANISLMTNDFNFDIRAYS